MGVAPLGGDAGCRRTPGSAERPAGSAAGHPDATVISAGMSGDFPEAMQAGATHVRVGSAVLGERPPLG